MKNRDLIQLSNLQNGAYVTEYNYDTDSANSSNTGSETRAETENRTLADKESLYKNIYGIDDKLSLVCEGLFVLSIDKLR